MKKPTEPPHVVMESLVELALEYGYHIRSMKLVYYDGLDEFLTTVRQQEKAND
jgi:hypothetical protein